MSDQNRFDPYKQKLLHYWGLFLAACGRFWEIVKKYAGTTADFFSRHGKVLGQKLAVFMKDAGMWLRKVWNSLCKMVRRLVQILAAWLLLARDKAEPWLQKAKVWLGEARDWAVARIRQIRLPQAMPDPQESKSLPEPEEAVPDEETQAPAHAEGILTRLQPANISNPWLAKAVAVLLAIGIGIKFVCKWILKLYKLIMAAPVIWFAVKFAMENMERLPEEVGLDIQSTGEFARMISRQEAVYWPLGITMFCLALMLISKKPILPWVISIFTLVLPWLIWLLNFYA